MIIFNEMLEYPWVEDNILPVYGRRAYHICFKIMNGPISTSLSLNCLIGWSTIGDQDVPPTCNLVAPCWLCMIQMICQVVKFWNLCETNRIQILDNIHIPLLQRLPPIFTTPFEVQLLWCSNAMLTIDYHELLVLNFIPVLRLSL